VLKPVVARYQSKGARISFCGVSAVADAAVRYGVLGKPFDAAS
jgi:hypothetical protein